jgi:prefoldin subunit 5
VSNTVEPQFQKELNKRELKIEHYRQKCAQLEEANADLRVELTVVSQELDAARQELEQYATQTEAPDSDETDDVS